MLGRLVLLFLLTPAIELGLLIQVDALIGFWPTVGLIVATGIAGSYLARREGISAWRRLTNRLRSGDLPGTELVDGVIILVAGALLVTPGVLTDILGFLGLIPLTRALFRRILIRRFQRKMEEGTMQIQFGIFGSSPSNTAPPDWASQDQPIDPDSNDRWEGRRQQMPGHSDDTPHDPSTHSDDSDSS